LLWKKIKYKINKVLQSQYSDCAHHVVEMDDEEFCVPDDVLEEASAAKYQMVPTKSKLRYQKELEIFTQWQTEIKGKDESSISAVIQC
jgi:hypothetical protein